VVLAGGAGKRLGGAKAEARVAGRPLSGWALEVLDDLVMEGVLAGVAIVCKAETRLPDVGATPVWFEPDEPRHPLAGVVHALRCAEGSDVVVVAVDLPLVRAETVRRLVGAPAAVAVVAAAGEEQQPLLGRYSFEALASLETALTKGEPVFAAVDALGPLVVQVADGAELLNVNEPQDVLAAEAALRAR
jgi:molybdopterin-guanine dinucleotide biosynthesis protein A